MAIQLNTPRLQLHPFAPWDLLALIESDARFDEQTGSRAAAGLRDFFVSGDVSPGWLEQLRSATTVDPWTHGFALVHPESQSVIGTAGFKGPPNEAGMVEIAYGVVPTYQGQGLATEAAEALVRFARGFPQVRTIRAHTAPANNASTRVLAKNGFSKVGEVLDPEDGLVWRWERTA